MKIRYYLRGLGLGILFTAIFFLVSNNNSAQTMSDEQIKARAKELGMIESTVLAELPEQGVKETESVVEETLLEEASTVEVLTEENSVEEMISEEANESIETVVDEISKETMEESKVEESVSEETVEPESIQEENIADESEQATDNTVPVTVVVNRGEGSDTVSRRLVELGLVADAYEYDRYLMTNGYDKKIGAGEHVVPAGATWEEIAKILCNQM